jgi:predicted metal-dependent peptidase
MEGLIMLNTDEKIISAKAYLLTQYPFFGSLVAKTKLIKADEEFSYMQMKTMFTEGENIYYFSEFIDKHSVKDIAWSIAHELLHIIFKHPSREGRREHLIWGMACDYAINSILAKEFKYILDGVLYESQFDGMSAEQIYDILDKSTIKIDIDIDIINNDAGIKTRIKGEDYTDIKKYIEDLAKVWGKKLTKDEEEEIDKKVIEAYAYVKSIGKTSEPINRIVGIATKIYIDWRDILSQYLEYDNLRQSYKHFNRKYIDDDIYLPIHRSEYLSINLAFDVSGSISDELLKKFYAETKYILGLKYDKMNIHVYQVDTHILWDKIYTLDEMDDDFTIRHGSGGTDFNSFFKKLNKEGNTDPVIFFTDGDAYIPDKEPIYPVIWITTRRELPWGINIKYEEDD